MPLGIVDNSEFESELNNSGAPIYTPPTPKEDVKTPELVIDKGQNDLGPVVTSDSIIKRLHEHGRNEGDVNVPQSLRKLIGDTATFEGRPAALSLAKELGISSSSVSGYTNPSNSSLAESNKEDIFALLTNRKTKISRRALNKLNMAISLIDEGKLSDLSARDLSSVAKDMAQVAKHMEPPDSKDKEVAPVQFIMFAPQVRNESHYEVVTAKDNY